MCIKYKKEKFTIFEMAFIILALSFFYILALKVINRWRKVDIRSRNSLIIKVVTIAFITFMVVFSFFQEEVDFVIYWIIVLPLLILGGLNPYSYGLRKNDIAVEKLFFPYHGNVLHVIGENIRYEEADDWLLIEEENRLVLRFTTTKSGENEEKELLFEKEQKQQIIALLENKGVKVLVRRNNSY